MDWNKLTEIPTARNTNKFKAFQSNTSPQPVIKTQCCSQQMFLVVIYCILLRDYTEIITWSSRNTAEQESVQSLRLLLFIKKVELLNIDLLS